MYLTHFGLNEPPFRITPHTDFFYEGANRGATLEALLYAITHDEGIVKVTGEVGTGKTMLCRVLMERLPANVETIYLANPSLARDEILIAIADELKLGLGNDLGTRVLRAIQDALIRLYGEGRRVVVLIDEAHAMPRETLEEIRLLSNLEANRHKLLQIVLFGQPELDDELNAVEMRQLKERITHGFRLSPLGQVDVESYVDFRLRAAGYRGPMPFTRAAMRQIAAASEGLTRRVNILADKSLLAAFAANSHSVTEREVRRAIEDSPFYRPTRRSYRGLVAGVLAAGALGGFAVAWLLLQPSAVSTAQPVALIAPTPSPPAPDVQSGAKVAPAQAAPANGEGAVPAGGKLTQARFEATRQWLASTPGKHHSIQLLTVKDIEMGLLENFLVRASRLVPEQDLHVYRVKINGVQHYRAAFGDFAGVQQASEAMKELPPELRALNPYQRSVERMKSQDRQ